jgi:type III secretion system YscI/HrpB-like protein
MTVAGEVIATLAQASGPSWVDTPVLSDAAPADAARLTDLLAPQPGQVQAPSGVGAVETGSGNSVGNSIGDSILRSLDTAGQAYKTRADEINRALNTQGELTTNELLRVQLNLMEASLRVDVLSKAVSKVTQHVDQLTKLQ